MLEGMDTGTSTDLAEIGKFVRDGRTNERTWSLSPLGRGTWVTTCQGHNKRLYCILTYERDKYKYKYKLEERCSEMVT